MAIMTCKSCQILFEGRPNREYCSIDCRRIAEMKEREIKKEVRRQARIATMPSEERALYDCYHDWGKSIPTAKELWPDLKPWSDDFSKTVA